MVNVLIRIISISSNLFILFIFIDILISFFVSPSHRIRLLLDKIVQPLLAPIRKHLPLIANIDFSPVILILIVQIVSFFLVRILSFM